LNVAKLATFSHSGKIEDGTHKLKMLIYVVVAVTVYVVFVVVADLFVTCNEFLNIDDS